MLFAIFLKIVKTVGKLLKFLCTDVTTNYAYVTILYKSECFHSLSYPHHLKLFVVDFSLLNSFNRFGEGFIRSSTQ